MEKAIRAAQKLKEGLAHHDSFGAQPDDQCIWINGTDDCLYELPFHSEGGGQFNLGHLRDLLSFFTEQGYV